MLLSLKEEPFMDLITKTEGRAAPWKQGQAARPEASAEAERDLGDPGSVAAGQARWLPQWSSLEGPPVVMSGSSRLAR
jgi:hypothetical protein